MKQGAEEFLNTVEERIGVEKVRELVEDNEFFLKTFPDEIEGCILAFSVMILMSNTELEVENAVKAIIISAIEIYRDWLSQKGIDIRKLEGRNG